MSAQTPAESQIKPVMHIPLYGLLNGIYEMTIKSDGSVMFMKNDQVEFVSKISYPIPVVETYGFDPSVFKPLFDRKFQVKLSYLDDVLTITVSDDRMLKMGKTKGLFRQFRIGTKTVQIPIETEC